MSFSSELMRRRVLQSLGIYLAGSWIAVEFSNWAEERYLLSPHLTDIILLALLCMLPGWLMFAWYHGAPGKDRWHRAEKVGIPLNLIATLGVLWMAFGGKDLGAAAQTVTVTDELGETKELVVPREAYLKTLGVFFWEFTGNSDQRAWLQYGFPLMVGQDLEQDPFIRVLTPYSDFATGIYGEFRRAGYVSGINVPVSLMARVANSYSMEYFVRGSFNEEGDGLRVDADLYQVSPTREVATFSLAGNDPMALMDELSSAISSELDVPEIGDTLHDDLPIRDHLTASLEALEQAVIGANAVLIDNDYPSAITAWNRALEIDPAFALVARKLGQANFMNGDTAAAAAAYQQALQHNYRLQETGQYIVKSMDYFLRGEIEKRTRLIEMWTELSPNNPDAHLALADVYVFVGNRYDDAIRELQIAAELMPNEARIYQGIGRLQMLAGDDEAALENFRRYADLRPEDPDALESVGLVYERRGDLDQAQEYYEQSSLIADRRVDGITNLARLARKRGDYEAVEQAINEAMDLASTPHDLSKVLMQRIALYDTRGLLHQRLEASRDLLRVSEEFRSPLEILLGYQQPLTNSLARVGRGEEALELLRSTGEKVGPPINQFTAFSYADVYLKMGRLDEAQEQIEAAERVADQFQQDHLRFILYSYRGELAFRRGEFEAAVEAFGRAADAYQGGLAASAEPGAEAWFLALKARSQARLERWDQVEATIKQVLALDPGNPLAHLIDAERLARTGAPAAAREALSVARHAYRNADPEFEYGDDLARVEALVLPMDP